MSQVTESLFIPYYVIYGLIVLCFVMVAFAYVVLLIRDAGDLVAPLGDGATCAEAGETGAEVEEGLAMEVGAISSVPEPLRSNDAQVRGVPEPKGEGRDR